MTAIFTGVDLQMGLEAVAVYFNWLSLLPIAAFGVFLFVLREHRRRNVSALAAISLALVVFFAASTYFTSNHYYAPSFSNFARTIVSYPTGWYIGTINGPPQGIAYTVPRAAVTTVSGEPAKNNIVFIVDESVRGDRLSINGNPQKTTPTLDALFAKGSIANWGIAAAGTTCSHTANPLLLTGLDELPDRSFEVYRWPTIFQYAKASGYRNHYIDAHTDVQWLGKHSDIPDYGQWTKASDLGSTPRYERDAEIARRVRTILENSTGNFIWVHKYGVHLRYENSFPNDRYGESMNGGGAKYDPYQSADALSAVYDQALNYNLESFFSALFANGPAPNTTYIYTSDHGQSLRDNGIISSHCNESRSAAIVPLMMIGQKLPTVDTNFKASHENIFATLLDLMSYPESERQFPYRKSLLKAIGADSQPRFFYDGQLHLAERFAFD
jgi:glucan phosphoethanolaminetransferase (alkaline phosphatase superfamily)